VLGRTRNAVMLALANRVFDRALPTLNSARAAQDLTPLDSFYDQVLESDRILVLTSPTFDFAAPSTPSNARYLGPILDDPSWAEPWQSPWTDDAEDPLVLVGFSSTYQDQGPLLRRVVAALAKRPVRAVVTLGQMLDPDEVPATHNVHVVPSAPHNPILEQAALVITHCGHGTTLKTLAAGVPLLCIPMGRDQNDTAARVVSQGAGIRLAPTASVSKIGQAIDRLVTDHTYTRAARRVAAAIAEERRAVDVATELEAVAASHRGGIHK
jgi:MGT family glycosyltransferase